MTLKCSSSPSESLALQFSFSFFLFPSSYIYIYIYIIFFTRLFVSRGWLLFNTPSSLRTSAWMNLLSFVQLVGLKLLVCHNFGNMCHRKMHLIIVYFLNVDLWRVASWTLSRASISVLDTYGHVWEVSLFFSLIFKKKKLS